MTRQRYEQEIEEILRRQRSGESRGASPSPAPATPPAPRFGGGAGPGLPPGLGRVFATPAERLYALSIALAVVSYFARLMPPSPLPAVLAVAAAAALLVAIAGTAFGWLRPNRQTYWRNRPIDIGSSGDFNRRLGYTWWRIRVGVRRLFGGR